MSSDTSPADAKADFSSFKADGGPGSEAPAANGNDRTLSWYSAREPLVIIVLCAIGIGFLFLVSGLSKVYQRALSDRATFWSSRGQDNIRAGRFDQAVADFQTALTYSRANYGYELNLAQSLLALKRTEEARAYLINLWQREPENGSVNLELARIFAAKDDVTSALRYYHNAIYAVWNTNPDVQQLSVRLELVNFLLNHKANNLAVSELIAIGRNVPEDASLQAQIGDLFMKVPDYQRALAVYQQALKLDRRDPEALTRAGRAAFELGQYRLAEHYLMPASAAKPNAPEIIELLNMCRTIPTMDPYNFYSATQRDRIVMSDFNTAGERLNGCINSTTSKTPGNSPLQPLYAQWVDMKTRLNEKALREHPELIDPAMNLVFNIERETGHVCSNPIGNDLLLSLIAKNHQGS